MNQSLTPSGPTPLPRRTFLKTTAGLALGAAFGSSTAFSAASQRRVLGANDRLRIGVIGCGDRGLNAHMAGVQAHAQTMNLEIVALADPWRVAREKAAAKVTEWFGRAPRQFVSYRELLALDDIDAVMIASPDHHHTTHLEAAARARKHIYVEKPLAMEWDKLLRAVDAVKAAGTVVQVGTQLRGLPGIVGAHDLAATGVLGRWSRIEECRNQAQPYWYGYLKDVAERDVDWAEFLGDREKRPFRADYYSGWYGYRDFTHGPLNNLGVHFIDMVHYITGAKFPESCVATGGSFTWKDEHEFTCPDCAQATWIYPEGFLVNSSNNLGNGYGGVRKFYAERGVLKVDNWHAPTYSAEGGPRRDGRIRGDTPVTLVERPDHFLDWLQCIRTGRTPHAPIEAGFQHAVAVLMAHQAFVTGRKTIYDQASRTIRTV